MAECSIGTDNSYGCDPVTENPNCNNACNPENKVPPSSSLLPNIPGLPPFNENDNYDLGVDIGTVTEIFVDKDGQYDKYMNAEFQQLLRLYDEGRIKGAEFAAAMVQASNFMMQNANQFVIAKYQADIQLAALEAELVDKKEQAAIQTELLKLQVKQAQIQNELAIEKIRTERLQQQLLVTQESELRKTGPVQRANTMAQTKISENQAKLTATQASELIKNGQSKRALENGQNKVTAAQCELYEAQKQGFKDKNKNDTFKTIMNGWAVSVAEQPGQDTIPPGLTFGDIGNTIGSAKTDTGLS